MKARRRRRRSTTTFSTWTSCKRSPGPRTPELSTRSPMSVPVLVRVHLQSLRGRDDVTQIHRVAERVLVELGDAIQLTLPAPQLRDIGFERDSPQVPIFLNQVADPVVQPLP